MNINASFVVFNVQITCTLVLIGLVVRWYVMPRLRTMHQSDALVVPLLASSIRFMGLIFLVPTVTPEMPVEFAVPTAYGDSAAAGLAFAAVIANRMHHKLGVPLAWLYLVFGGADLAYGFLQGFRYGLWDHLAGGWTYVVWGASLVIVGLCTTLLLLVRPNAAKAA